MKTLFLSVGLVLVVVAAGLAKARAADEPTPLMREFHMHAQNSTVAHPACLLVRQRLVSVENYGDQFGNISSVPVFRTEYLPVTCTHKAFAYEAKPGLGVDTRITSENAPWHASTR